MVSIKHVNEAFVYGVIPKEFNYNNLDYEKCLKKIPKELSTNQELINKLVNDTRQRRIRKVIARKLIELKELNEKQVNLKYELMNEINNLEWD